MKQIINSLILIVIIAAFSSCQKVIDVEVDKSASQLVIEANLTNINGLQYVKISRSVLFTDSNAFPGVSGAAIKITDNSNNVINFNETTKGTYIANSRGIPGRTYRLSVDVDGKNYSATSVMPAPVKLDTVTVTDLNFGDRGFQGVAAQYHDPAKTVNQYRFVLKINGVQSNRIYTDNDRLSNGNEIKTDLYPDWSDDGNRKFSPGDQIEVEMQCIDPNIFTYWFTLQQQERNGPGGGVTPSNPPSNISNGALGYFSAHTSQFKTMTLQ